MSTAAHRTPRAASFTGEAPPLEGRGGGRRARLMAGGAVAGSGLAAAGPEGRSPDSRRPGVGARAAAGGLRSADGVAGCRQAGWDWEGELGFRRLAIGLWPFGLAAGPWALGLSSRAGSRAGASRLGSARRFSEPRKEARLGSF